ncbi:MAG: TonB-dependent receptor [Terriglobia bacterium]|nr:MAG: TonB-dependent receptor [Terriglobia bacterium]
MIRILFAVLCAVTAWGQAISGDLVGTVTDATGAVVGNAEVSAGNVATGVRTTAKTNSEGQYRIANLLTGAYDVTATAAGFSASSVKGVVVDVNKVATVNLALQVGAVSTTVDVTSAPAVIDTTTATIQGSFDTTAARDLPVTSIGIGVVNLSLLQAGVTGNNNIGAGEGPSVGGQRPYNNNFMIEGVDNNNKSVTGSLLRIFPNDAVSEFTVLQNQMSAEFGHSSGGQFNTTVKSGTNQLHGTLYEYFQNRNLNAIDQQVQNQAISDGKRPKNTRFDSNRFGGSVGGPVIKNKLFYFGDFEYNPYGAEAVTPGLESPTAEGFARLAAIPGLSQTNLGILKQYVPQSTVAVDSTSVSGIEIPLGVPSLTGPNYTNYTAGVASVDYNLSDRDQVRGRYIYNKVSQIDISASLPAFYQLQPATYQLLSLAEYHTFSPAITNEFRLGYNRENLVLPAGNRKFPGVDQFPTILFNDLQLTLGPDPVAPQTNFQNTYQVLDNVTWAKGNHTLKVGFDGRKYIAPSSFTQRPRGEYGYSSIEIFLKDLTPDQEAQRGLGNVVYYGDQVAFYSFVNDTWRVGRNLTVTMGLRHEYTTVPYSERLQTLNAISNVPGLIEFREPRPQTTNFAPRAGIAYSPGSKGTTSIRAGFGMAYDVLYDNIGILDSPPQLKTTVDVTNRGNPLDGAPNFLANGGISPNLSVSLTPAQARANTSAWIPDQKVPYSIQWNFGVQHVFHKDYTFEARYLGTRGVHLDVQRRINKQGVVTSNQFLPTYLQRPSQAQLDSAPLTLADLTGQSNIVPAYQQAGFVNGGFVVNSPIGNSIYHGLALEATRRFSANLQFHASYTWSHLIDDSTADFNTTALTPRRPQDFQNMRPERGASALDRRHRLTIAAVYDTPWFKNAHWLLKNTVGNWSIAPIYTYETPEFVTVQSAQDANLNGDTASDRSIVNPAGRDGVGTDVLPLCKGAGPCTFSTPGVDRRIVGYVAADPNARYIRARRGALANGGRNTLGGRPANNFDLNLLKNLNFTERLRLQFSAQFYNLLNHPQFVPGYVNRVDVLSQLFNNTPAVVSYLTPGNPIFNNPEAIYSSQPRSIQLAVKLMF